MIMKMKQCPICDCASHSFLEQGRCDKCGYEELAFISPPSAKVLEVLQKSEKKAVLLRDQDLDLKKNIASLRESIHDLEKQIEETKARISEYEEQVKNDTELYDVGILENDEKELQKQESSWKEILDGLNQNGLSVEYDLEDRAVISGYLEKNIIRLHIEGELRETPTIIMGIRRKQTDPLVSIDQCDRMHQFIFSHHDEMICMQNSDFREVHYPLPFSFDEQTEEFMLTVFSRETGPELRIQTLFIHPKEEQV